MKIKTKKQLNLPQLIEWAWENDITNKRYMRSNSNPPEYVWINGFSNVELDEDMCISKNDTFTVTKDEEITEDTVIPKMVEIYLDRERDFDFADVHLNQSINKVKDDYEFGCKSLTFQKMNDDGTHTLIWRDGKLIKE